MLKSRVRKKGELLAEMEELRLRLNEAEETLHAIRQGEVDALVVSGPSGDQIFSLQGTEHMYRVLVESMNEGALTIAESGEIIYCNKAFLEMAGATFGKMVGIRFMDLVSEKDKQRLDILWKNALEGSSTDEVELNFNSGRIPVYLSLSARMQDEVLTVFAVATDISERKRAAEELQKAHDELEIKVRERTADLESANKELESFIYSVSHDLRGPLRHISTFTDLLRENAVDKLDEKGKRYLSRIYDGSEKMSRLIDDLLNLSRVSRQEIKRKEINMSTVAASVIAELREADPARIVEVDIKGDIVASVDDGLIRVVFSNLLGNAWKFTAKTERARIEFGTCKQDGKTIFYVRDNGAGFDQKYAAKMFWPFHRLHSEGEFEGTGIGLAIVERIIRGHKGKIWAEGIEGKGATIYFSLIGS